MIERTAGASLAVRFGARLAEAATGLPVQIVPGCAALAHADRRGRADAALVTQLLRGRGEIMAAFRRYFAEYPDQVAEDSLIETISPVACAVGLAADGHQHDHGKAASAGKGEEIITFNDEGRIVSVEVTDR